MLIRNTGEVLSVHIIGPAAAELINEASTIIEIKSRWKRYQDHSRSSTFSVLARETLQTYSVAIHAPKKNKGTIEMKYIINNSNDTAFNIAL